MIRWIQKRRYKVKSTESQSEDCGNIMQTFLIIIGVIIVFGILYYQGTADIKAYQASRDLIVVKEKLDTLQRQLDDLKRELEKMKTKEKINH